jgi:hypothetical protein
VITNLSDDAMNTPSDTVLLMHIGGGIGKGIHGIHVGQGTIIRYASDRAVDNAMSIGAISATLPMAKKKT